MTLHYDGVKEGLEVVIAVVADVGRGENGSDIGEGLGMVVVGLVVDDTDSFCTVGEENLIDSVGNASEREGKGVRR